MSITLLFVFKVFYLQLLREGNPLHSVIQNAEYEAKRKLINSSPWPLGVVEVSLQRR